VHLAGLAAMASAFRASDSTAKEPTVLRFEDLALRMPQLMLPVRQASGELRFPNGGVAADPVHGTLGGAPADWSVNWDRESERVDVRIRYLEGEAAGGPITGPRWLSGEVSFERLTLPEWPIQGLHVRLTAEGATVTVTGMQARLADGALEASGHLDLSQPERAPFDLDLGVSDFDPKQVCETFGLPPDSVTGRGYVKLKLSGVLRPGGDFRTEGKLEGRLVLREGTVARLPTLVAIARVPSLAGVTGLLVGKPLPYRTVEADLLLDAGKLGIADGKLLGPELRILASGEMDFNTPERHYDFLVALLFLQTLDRVLAEVPLVRNVMLGEDKNLIAVYLRVQGPRDKLTVTPLPPAAVSSVVGFASTAVVNGVKSLGRLIPIPRGTPKPEEPTPKPEESNPPPQGELPLR
jgi:hypothetical protein